MQSTVQLCMHCGVVHASSDLQVHFVHTIARGLPVLSNITVMAVIAMVVVIEVLPLLPLVL